MTLFFSPFPASFPWERLEGGVSAGIQSNGVKQSSYHSGGTKETSFAAGQGETRPIPPSRSGVVPFRRVDSQSFSFKELSVQTEATGRQSG